MQITRKSPFSGQTNTREINVTEEQLQKICQNGELIQRALPGVSAEDREFIKTGITPQEWNDMFGEE